MLEKRMSTPGKNQNFMTPVDQNVDAKPLRFWELEPAFKCPVVGMCLPVSHQKRILKKSGFSIKKKSLYEIHEILVGGAESENRLSRLVDNFLSRRFGEDVAFLHSLDHDEFMACFKTAFESGNYIGVVWAAAVSPYLPSESKRKIFGEIHMAMHLNGEQRLKLKQKIAAQQKQLSTMGSSLKEALQHRRSLHKENKSLKCTQADLQAAITVLKKNKTELENADRNENSRQHVAQFEQKNRLLKMNLEKLSGRIQQKQHQVVSLQEKNMRLSTKLDRQRDLNRHFNTRMHDIIQDSCDSNHCDASCPAFDLCEKRILIVGGITRMESLYRDLIESCGGIFEYHDGYMKKGAKKLESRFRRADIVLCPVSCNSHAACLLVKNLGKKHNKPVHMLPNSSLSTVSRAISDADDQVQHAQLNM